MILSPGFTLEDYFAKPVVTIPSCQSKTRLEPGQVTFEFNKHGYRTVDFDSVSGDYFLVLGCSLTEGHGLESNETWSYYLSQDLKIPAVNLAKGGSNAEFCCHNLKQWIPYSKNPTMAIVQWPNPFRATVWEKDQGRFYNITTANNWFKESLRLSDNNFWKTWIASIIDADAHCKHYNIPILHICLESSDAIPLHILDILKQRNIELHIDQKVDGKTWFFDSGAKDKLHHSSWCNRKWADRILTLLN